MKISNRRIRNLNQIRWQAHPRIAVQSEHRWNAAACRLVWRLPQREALRPSRWNAASLRGNPREFLHQRRWCRRWFNRRWDGFVGGRRRWKLRSGGARWRQLPGDVHSAKAKHDHHSENLVRQEQRARITVRDARPAAFGLQERQPCHVRRHLQENSASVRPDEVRNRHYQSWNGRDQCCHQQPDRKGDAAQIGAPTGRKVQHLVCAGWVGSIQVS